jgi:hypothetical protein
MRFRKVSLDSVPKSGAMGRHIQVGELFAQRPITLLHG